MIILLYSFIVLLATTIGAIAGLGGGIIIKPLFDMLAIHNASSISFYSSCAVFTMCIVSIIKQLKKGFTFDWIILSFISTGSLIGGLIGEFIFDSTINFLDESLLKVIQSIMLVITLLIILIYTINKEKINKYKIKNKTFIFLSGFFLGCISIFLGIGGGPLNVSLLIFLFSLDMKHAAVYSLATIFFSQISKLSKIILLGSITDFNLSLLPFICVSSILGGYLGTVFNQKLSSRIIEKIYMMLLIFLILVSCYNACINF